MRPRPSLRLLRENIGRTESRILVTTRGVGPGMATYAPIWSDDSDWASIADIVRDVSRRTSAATTYTEQQLSLAAAPYLRWRLTSGMSVDCAAFVRADIDHFVREGLSHYSTDAGRNTVRSRLLRIAETVNADQEAVPLLPLGGSAASQPYTPAEIRKLRRWAKQQDSESRVVDATVLLALGLGAGLRGQEIIALVATDVDREGVRVRAANQTIRRVPVLDEWQAELGLAASRNAWLFRPGRTSMNHNAITDFVARSAHRPSQLPITTRRMRATWLQHHQLAGTEDLARLAGVEHAVALLRYAS